MNLIRWAAIAAGVVLLVAIFYVRVWLALDRRDVARWFDLRRRAHIAGCVDCGCQTLRCIVIDEDTCPGPDPWNWTLCSRCYVADGPGRRHIINYGRDVLLTIGQVEDRVRAYSCAVARINERRERTARRLAGAR